MNDVDIFVTGINDYVSRFGTDNVMDVDEVLATAGMADKKGSILPTDYCYNRYNNGLGDFKGPHLFEYTDDRKFRVLGENYPYSGNVMHQPKGGPEYIWGHWIDGRLYEGEPDSLPESIILRRNDLKESLEAALEAIPVTVSAKEEKVLVSFQDLLICGVSIEEETYKIYNASSDWANKTTCLCEEDEDGTWHYYLETIDECIGECRRLVMFEAQKGKEPSSDIKTSELRRQMTAELFEKAYRIFIDQADKNAISKKSHGERLPYGITKEDNEKIKRVDGGGRFGMAQHYGQGAASKTPYINWFVVSVYYLPDTKNIVIGIERERYPKLNQMKPNRYSELGNRNTDVAIFYETRRDSLDYAKLYDRFIEVSEEVMRLEGWH